MDDAKFLSDAISALNRDGGHIGGWKVAPAGDHLEAGGQGAVLFGSRRNIRGQDEAAAIKVKLPHTLPDGSALMGEPGDLFAHEFDVLEHLERSAGSPYLVRPLQGGIHEFTMPSGSTIDVQYFAQEQLAGPHLGKLIAFEGILDGEDWLDLAHDLLCAAVTMHDSGVIHQDIKPNNVMRHNDRYITIDLGVASYIDKPDPGDAACISIGYTAPEQMHPKFDQSTSHGHVDIYSIACTLVYAARGSSPWVQALAQARLQERREVGWGIVLNAMLNSEPDLSGLTSVQRKLVEPMLGVDFRSRPSAVASLEAVIKAMAASNIRRKNYRAHGGAPTIRGEIAKKDIASKKRSTAAPKQSRTPVAPAARERAPKAKRPLRMGSIGPLANVPVYWVDGNVEGGYAGRVPLIRFVVNQYALAWMLLAAMFSYGTTLAGALYLWLSDDFAAMDRKRKAHYLRRHILGATPMAGATFGLWAAVRTDIPRARIAGVAAVAATVPMFSVVDATGSAPYWAVALASIMGQVTPIVLARAEVGTPPVVKRTTKSMAPLRDVAPQTPPSVPDLEARAFAEDDSGRPAYEVTWDDITTEMYAILEQAGKRQFVINVVNGTLEGVFVQGYSEGNGAATVEAAADLSVRPKITVRQRDALNALGWESPSRDLPNFIRFVPVEESAPEDLAKFFIATLRDGYGIAVAGIRLE